MARGMIAKRTAGVTASTTMMDPKTLARQLMNMETVLPKLVSSASVSLQWQGDEQNMLLAVGDSLSQLARQTLEGCAVVC